MPLPKISVPLHQIEVPSTKKKVSVRQMTIKEEKVLMSAKESDEAIDRLNAIINTVNACIMEEGFETNKLTMYDIEYLFMRLRALSVSNIVPLTLNEFGKTDDGEYDYDNIIKTHDFSVDLSEVKMQEPDEPVEDTITIDDVVIQLRHPPVEMYTSKEYLEQDSEADITGILMRNSIKGIFQGDKAFPSHSKEELNEFIDSLPPSALEAFNKYITSQPHLYYKVEYVRQDGETETYELASLSDFFTF